MKRLRFLIATMVLWLFLLYNIERLSQPINMTSVCYILIAVVAALTILIPQLQRTPLYLVLGVPVALFLAFKSWLGIRVWGSAIPLTVTEMSFNDILNVVENQGFSNNGWSADTLTVCKILILLFDFSPLFSLMGRSTLPIRNGCSTFVIRFL